MLFSFVWGLRCVLEGSAHLPSGTGTAGCGLDRTETAESAAAWDEERERQRQRQRERWRGTMNRWPWCVRVRARACVCVVSVGRRQLPTHVIRSRDTHVHVCGGCFSSPRLIHILDEDTQPPLCPELSPPPIPHPHSYTDSYP